MTATPPPPRPLRVLLIEDNPGDARLVRKALEVDPERRVDLTWVQLLADGLDILRGGDVDAVLLDLNLPDSRAGQTIERLHALAENLPVIVLTNQVDEATAYEAVRAGAQDYVFKQSLSQSPLTRTLHYALERQTLKRALAKRIDEVENILNALPDPVMVLGTDGRLMSWNSRLEDVTGRTAAELGSGSVLQLLPDHARAGFLKALKVTPLQPVHSLEAPLLGKGGKEIPFLWTTKIFSTGDPELSAVIAGGKDLSDRRAAEESGRRAEAATFRSNFLNAVAHELRTPLTPIRTQMFVVNQLLKSNRDPELRKSLDIMGRGVERLHHLIDDTLDASRIHQGKFPVSPKPADLRELCQHAAASFTEAARAGGVTITVEVSASLPGQYDPDRLTQVLENLIDNAFKHTPPGGHIVVGARREANEVVLFVVDTGTGFTAVDQEKLFQPFSTLDRPSVRKRRGSGLGLFICKGIVEAHGGRIWCTSAGLGQGSVFYVSVPVSAPGAIIAPKQTVSL